MSQRSRIAPRIDERWIRHDAHLRIRSDIARWMKPGAAPADIIPALAARMPHSTPRSNTHAQAALRVELNEIKAELGRRRLPGIRGESSRGSDR
jgi:hypothetical protein